MELSIVAPARDEAPNIAPLVACIGAAMAGHDFELIIVDDGSRDATAAEVAACTPAYPWLRCIRTPGTGQSGAFWAGFRAARGALIATIDADLQNDPADLPRLIEVLRASGADLVQGDRSAARRDNAVRRIGAAVGRVGRSLILGDPTRDTGCSLRVMKRDLALALPLDLRGMHRLIPALARDLGFKVAEVPVGHGARIAGETKYGLGLRRALPSLLDALAVRYLRSRRTAIRWTEAAPAPAGDAPSPREAHA